MGDLSSKRVEVLLQFQNADSSQRRLVIRTLLSLLRAFEDRQKGTDAAATD